MDPLIASSTTPFGAGTLGYSTGILGLGRITLFDSAWILKFATLLGSPARLDRWTGSV